MELFVSFIGTENNSRFFQVTTSQAGTLSTTVGPDQGDIGINIWF